MPLNPINTSSVNIGALNSPGSIDPIINSFSIFGVFNTASFNVIPVNGSYNVITENAATVASEIEQNVGIFVASEEVVDFPQDVQFRVTFEGEVVEIDQSVINEFSGSVVEINQNIMGLTANTFFNRNGWTVDLTIGGYVVPHDRIFKDIIITKEENQSNQCVFSLLVADPVEFIDAMWGQNVTVDYTTASGTVRMFTGVVAIPEIDIINRNVRFTCSNNRDEIINNTMSSFVKTVGRYSEPVQGKFDTVAEEMNLRMQTVPYSLDFTGTNVANLNSWYAKSVADFTLADADIYYREPKVIWQDRTKIKNDYSINVNYQYTRLYHHQQPFSWNFPYEFCDFLEWQYSLPTVQMIKTAIANAGWITVGNITFTSVFPPGSCVFGDGLLVFWNTNSFGNRGTYSTVFDDLGNVISDPDGNNVYGFTPNATQEELSDVYTRGASWTGSTRFTQYIEENYSINVHSTQSINQFGSVTDADSVSLKDDFDASSWENYKVYTPAPGDAVSFAGGSYYFNAATNPDAVQQAILTQIDLAKASILSTHRNTQVIVDTPLKPGYELSHTIGISTSKLVAKGKIQRLVHTLSVSEGKGSSTNVTLALFRSRGSATTTPTAAPARPTDTISIASNPVVLGSHYGVTDDSFNGHIGNKNNPRVIGTLKRTDVDEEFRVDTPAIPDSLRKLRQLPVSASYEIAIPNDPLDITL
jgi:hypothetical protein